MHQQATCRRPPLGWPVWLTLALLSSLSGWATVQVMNYATGQDPRIYLHLAEKIRAASYSFESIAACASWVVPGYPLLMAVGLDTVGMFATYWLNLPIFMGWLWILALLLRRLSGPWETAVALSAVFGVLMTGHPLYPHFIFLPFRNAVEWMFMFAVLLAAWPAFDPRAGDRSRCLAAVTAGLLTLAGAVFRETIMFVGVPLALLLLMRRVAGDRGAGRALLAMAVPVVVVALGFVVWRLSEGSLLNTQARVWLIGLRRGGYASPFPVLLTGILSDTEHALRWGGLAALALGSWWALRRRQVAMVSLLVTAVLLMLFYAMYKSHVRYTLSSVGLLAVVAGWGGALALSAVTARFRPGWVPHVMGVAVAGLLAWSGSAISRFEAWGVRVSRHDIEQLRAHPLAGETAVFVEKNQRQVVDALLAFTPVDPLDPVFERDRVVEHAGAFFLRPTKDRGLVIPGVKSEDWLRRFFDLVPTGDQLKLGEASYDILRAEPWTNRVVTWAMPEALSVPGVCWLDFQAGVPAPGAVIAWMSATGRVERTIHPAQGLVPVWVDDVVPGSMPPVFSVSSEHALPADLSPEWVAVGQGRWINMEQWRRPSAMTWLGEGFERRSMQIKHGASVVSNAVLRLPQLVGAPEGLPVSVTVKLMPRPVVREEISGAWGPVGEGRESVPWRIRPGFDQTTITWEGQQPAATGLALALTITQRPENLWYVRTERIAIVYGRPVAP